MHATLTSAVTVELLEMEPKTTLSHKINENTHFAKWIEVHGHHSATYNVNVRRNLTLVRALIN